MHKYILPIIISLSGVILVVNCSNSPRYTTGGWNRSKPVKKVNSTAKSKKILKGVSSYYGEDFHGKLTANGEVYDMYGVTAAHKELPLNTVARVTNIDNDKSIILRINDRGPFVKGRILDCSMAAAKKLGFFDKGTANVKIEVLKWGDNKYYKN